MFRFDKYYIHECRFHEDFPPLQGADTFEYYRDRTRRYREYMYVLMYARVGSFVLVLHCAGKVCCPLYDNHESILPFLERNISMHNPHVRLKKQHVLQMCYCLEVKGSVPVSPHPSMPSHTMFGGNEQESQAAKS
jgi:hypothetical protein